jgi:predicted adenylyl cyclase CyaB
MPSNVEIKAKVKDWSRVIRLAQSISDTPVEIFQQEDIYFKCAGQQRLKLRISDPNSGELILYRRSDSAVARRSDYTIAQTVAPAALKSILSEVLGIVGIVRKQRLLYIAGQTRIHMDDVYGLGHFIELEFVMRPDQQEPDGIDRLGELASELDITDQDLLSVSYIDLMPK